MLCYMCSGSKRKIDCLQNVQRRAARKTVNSTFDALAAPFIQILEWPTISNRIKSFTGIHAKAIRCSESNDCVLSSTDADIKLLLFQMRTDQQSYSCRRTSLQNSASRESELVVSLSFFEQLSFLGLPRKIFR